MPTVRDVLNELRWRHQALDQVVVWYVHRGAPGDRRAVAGDRIVDLHASFMELKGPRGGTMIPYHRLLRVERGGRVVWQRHPQTLGEVLDEQGAKGSDADDQATPGR